MRITKTQRAWLANVIQTPRVRRLERELHQLIRQYGRSKRSRVKLSNAARSYVLAVRDTTYRKAVER